MCWFFIFLLWPVGKDRTAGEKRIIWQSNSAFHSICLCHCVYCFFISRPHPFSTTFVQMSTLSGLARLFSVFISNGMCCESDDQNLVKYNYFTDITRNNKLCCLLIKTIVSKIKFFCGYCNNSVPSWLISKHWTELWLLHIINYVLLVIAPATIDCTSFHFLSTLYATLLRLPGLLRLLIKTTTVIRRWRRNKETSGMTTDLRIYHWERGFFLHCLVPGFFVLVYTLLNE